MSKHNFARIASNTLYSIGIVVVVALVGIVTFGEGFIQNPDAMIPYSLRDYAFVGLAVGLVPMLLVTMAVYKSNDVRHSVCKRRNFILLFAPVFICGICLLVVLGVLVVMIVKAISGGHYTTNISLYNSFIDDRHRLSLHFPKSVPSPFMGLLELFVG
jgi:hypothetical protein